MAPLLAALPILVELFTSEGCSSCPPADKVLAQLHQQQPVKGVELLVLSEHVDYWNSLGWRDPFSDGQFTDRQHRYAPVVARDRVYTPQAVVDGQLEVLGSDQRGLERAAAAAAEAPHGTLRLTCSKDVVHIEITGLPAHAPAQVLLAVVEDGLVSTVTRGENSGHALPHTAVVRSLRGVGSIAKQDGRWTGDVPLQLDGAWKKPRLVAFVQDRESLHVLAAGGSPL